jgi:hypothetical protein
MAQRTHADVLRVRAMTKERVASLEAQALERIVSGARRVHAASSALRAKFGEDGARQRSTLELVRFAAAMQELTDAREAFDAMVSETWRDETKVCSPLFTGESPKRRV